MDEPVTFRPTATKLMDQLRETLRFYHYAYNTEKSYVEWILKFIRFNGKKHPREMGKFEIERFLSHHAVNRRDFMGVCNHHCHLTSSKVVESK